MSAKGKLVLAASILLPPALLWLILWTIDWIPLDTTFGTLAMILAGYAGWAAFLRYIAGYADYLRKVFPDSELPSSVPYQASRPLPEFIGRKDELRRLTRALKPGSKAAITGLVGMGGLGKTELAKRAAQQVRKRFQDGVLWADCGEQDLITLPDLWAAEYRVQLPGDDPQVKAAAWRGWVADKRVLLIFDNVQPDQNLEPLLPVSDTPTVLITTRATQHPALLGAELLRLDQFTLDEALALAAEILGNDNVHSQEADAERLFGLVGYLPLAINVSLQLARECNYPLARLNSKLEAAGALEVIGERERLEKSLYATFQTAWANLPDDLREPFRTLSLFNQGPSFSTQALADTLALDPDDAGALLHRLAGRSLLTVEAEGRWSLHPLLREFVDTFESLDYAAYLRFARHYVGVCWEANRLYKQGGEDALQSLALFDLEWPHIRAGQAWAAVHAKDDRKAARLCNDFPNVAFRIIPLRLNPNDQLAWREPALRAARNLGDVRAQGWHLGGLAGAYHALGDLDKASVLFEQKLKIDEWLGDSDQMADDYHNLATVDRSKGELDRAIEFGELALELDKRAGNRHGMAQTYNNLGLVYADKGEYDRGVQFWEQALEIFEQLEDLRGMAGTYNNLGLFCAAAGEWGRAVEIFEQALVTIEPLGDTQMIAGFYSNLGMAYRGLGELDRARACWTKALALFESIGHRHAERVRRKLAALDD